jgi:Na+/melibiose symporter-like transporter
MLNGIAGMLAIIVFGHLLDFAKLHIPGGLTIGFGFIIGTAVLAGLVSLVFLLRISEPQKDSSASYPSLQENLLGPLQERNFRKLLLFSLCWNLSVNFAAPFFSLYMLRDLTFSLGFVSTLAMISSGSDLIAMKLWGKISDRIKNKAIIQISSWVVVFLPFMWIFVRPDSIVMPIFLHILGGGFWAGIQLCSNNLILRISPKQQRALFISIHNIIAGLGAAISPIIAGLILKLFSSADIFLISEKILPLHFIFAISTAFRFFSLLLLRKVHEPEEVTVGQLIRILRNVRGLNTSNGFNSLLHPFVAMGEKKEDHNSQIK